MSHKPLTELKIKSLKPRKERWAIADGRGLYLVVMPTGEKYWYHRTWKDGKETKRALGRWPDIGLKEARELNYTRRAPQKETPLILSTVAEDWWKVRCIPSLRPTTLKCKGYFLNGLVLPELGGRDMRTLTPQDALAFIRRAQETHGAHTGHRAKIILSQIFRFAIAAGLVDWDPTAQIAGALPPLPPSQHWSVVATEDEARHVLQTIDRWGGPRIIRLGLLLLAYTFVRPGEMAGARWQELDFEKEEWRIPPERMKMRREHVVPLSPQALALFRQLREATRHPVWCFVAHGMDAPYPPKSFSYHMRKMGFGKGKMTPHGFRGMASTLLNEHGFRPDAIERQLAHIEPNAVRAAYDRAEHMEERRKMMQWWGGYLERIIHPLPQTAPSRADVSP